MSKAEDEEFQSTCVQRSGWRIPIDVQSSGWGIPINVRPKLWMKNSNLCQNSNLCASKALDEVFLFMSKALHEWFQFIGLTNISDLAQTTTAPATKRDPTIAENVQLTIMHQSIST